MRIAFILPGLHRMNRGAEVAFESVAKELAKLDEVEVTLFGSGESRKDDPYYFKSVACISREHFERFPRIPAFRSEYAYEEFTFAVNLRRQFSLSDFDIVVSCTYPFLNWVSNFYKKGKYPIHIYVTQNGDYEIQNNHKEYRFFNCDGLICTNPEYFERNKNSWNTALIPNGIDPSLFTPGQATRNKFNLPENVPLVLMVSALIPYKRVIEGIHAVSKIDSLHLVICGDGMLREQVRELGKQLMPGRLHLRNLPRAEMPNMYRSTNLLLHMSLYEPFGNVYIEALATGLPVVAHRNQVTSWICEEAAILIDTMEKPEVIKAIHKALAFEEDVSKWRPQIETRFSWAGIAQQYLSFFKELLK